MKSYLTPKIVWPLRLLCCVALGISAYLTWAALNKSGVAGCGGSVFSCDHVLSSRWSNWFSIPVAMGAMGLYAAMIVALSFCGEKTSETFRRLALRILTMSGLAAGLAAIWFISLQVFAIGHFCSYCLGAHACGLIIATMILWKRPLGTRPTAAFSTASMAGVAVLIGGQILTPPPPTFHVEYHASTGRVAATIEPERPSQRDKSSSAETESPVTEAPNDSDVFEAPGEDVFEAPAVDDDVFEAPTFND